MALQTGDTLRTDDRNEAGTSQTGDTLCTDDGNGARTSQTGDTLRTDDENGAGTSQMGDTLCTDDGNGAGTSQNGDTLRTDDGNGVGTHQTGDTLRTDDGNGVGTHQTGDTLRTDDGNEAEALPDEAEALPVQGQAERNVQQRNIRARVQQWAWTDTPVGGNYRPRNVPFEGNPWLTNPLPDEDPYSIFKLYFTDAMLDKIVQETNKYADQYLQANRETLRPHSIVHSWKPTTAAEMNTFLGLCTLMGIVYKP